MGNNIRLEKTTVAFRRGRFQDAFRELEIVLGRDAKFSTVSIPFRPRVLARFASANRDRASWDAQAMFSQDAFDIQESRCDPNPLRLP